MPEQNKRVVVEYRDAAKKFQQVVDQRLNAEHHSEELLGQLRELERLEREIDRTERRGRRRR